MELNDALLAKLSGVAAALAGGLMTGLFSIYATKKAIHRENEKEQKREDKEVQNLLDALGVEISTLWGFHMARIGAMLETLPLGKALEFYYPLTQDYFTIYNSNAAHIGRVKNAQLREAIVVCYNKCKKVVDGFKYNNELFRDHRDLVNMSDDGPADQKRIDAKFKELIDYAQVLKEDHFEVKGYVEQLISLLEKRSVIN